MLYVQESGVIFERFGGVQTIIVYMLQKLSQARTES